MLRRLMMAGGAGSGGSSLLEGLAQTPVLALSLHQVIGTATAAVRVRRSSDNAEQDIGFSGGALDTAGLASFVGANSAYVTTLYDQTGNGFHAVQATAANQPRIVNAGTYDGKLVFDGSNDFLKITTPTLGTPQVGVYGKFQLPNNGAVVIIAEASTNYNNNDQSFVLYRDSSTSGEFNVAMRNTTGAVDYRLHSFSVFTGSMRGVTTLLDRSKTTSSEMVVFDNGTAASNNPINTTEQTGNFISYDLYLGGRGGASLFSNLLLESFVLYNSDTASIRTSIEAIVA